MDRRCFQFPVIEAIEEHFSQIILHLPICLLQTAKLVHNEVCYSLKKIKIKSMQSVNGCKVRGGGGGGGGGGNTGMNWNGMDYWNGLATG